MAWNEPPRGKLGPLVRRGIFSVALVGTEARSRGNLLYRLVYTRLHNISRTRYNDSMCWFCGSPVTGPEPIGRSLRCPDCGRDLRSCRNCRSYLPGSRGDCRESQAEPVADKERGNFCDWFSLNEKYRGQSAGEGKAKDASASAEARRAFDKLFG